MAKLRKTRAQKTATAQKRSEFTYSFTPKTPIETRKNVVQKSQTLSHTVLIKADLQKTVITSFFLLAAQLLLLFLLQHHIITIPGATY